MGPIPSPHGVFSSLTAHCLINKMRPRSAAVRGESGCGSLTGCLLIGGLAVLGVGDGVPPPAKAPPMRNTPLTAKINVVATGDFNTRQATGRAGLSLFFQRTA